MPNDPLTDNNLTSDGLKWNSNAAYENKTKAYTQPNCHQYWFEFDKSNEIRVINDRMISSVPISMDFNMIFRLFLFAFFFFFIFFSKMCRWHCMWAIIISSSNRSSAKIWRVCSDICHLVVPMPISPIDIKPWNLWSHQAIIYSFSEMQSNATGSKLWPSLFHLWTSWLHTTNRTVSNWDGINEQTVHRRLIRCDYHIINVQSHWEAVMAVVAAAVTKRLREH